MVTEVVEGGDSSNPGRDLGFPGANPVANPAPNPVPTLVDFPQTGQNTKREWQRATVEIAGRQGLGQSQGTCDMRGVSRLSAAASKSSGSEQRARLNLGNVPCALDAARSRDAVLTDDAGGLLGGCWWWPRPGMGGRRGM